MKAMLADASPAVATRAVGASGTVRGVTVIMFDTAPSPTGFTARSSTW